MSAFPKPSSWAVSAVVHAGVFVWLLTSAARAGEPPPPPPPSFEIQMTPPPPPPSAAPPPPPEPAPTSTPPPELVPKASPVSTTPPSPSPPPPEKVVESAPPPESAPLDLTGTTLADDRGAFAVRAGNGAPMTGPIGPGGGGARAAAAATGRPGGTGTAAPAPPPRAPELTPRENLSRLPSPPDLSGALLASYPERAKAAGERGRATVSLVVHPDGHVGGLEVRAASAPEFAEACLAVLRGSRWGAPLDKEARPTASRVGYTCQFDVR